MVLLIVLLEIVLLHLLDRRRIGLAAKNQVAAPAGKAAFVISLVKRVPRAARGASKAQWARLGGGQRCGVA